MTPKLTPEVVAKFTAQLKGAVLDTLRYMEEETERSIRFGSEITGAPGQPVSTGFLINSWITDREADGSFTISTNVAYAPVIEDNSRAAFEPQGVQAPKREPGAGALPKSTVGGNHSVKLTRAGMDKITDVAVRQAFAGIVRR
jgi:hypothetical protein